MIASGISECDGDWNLLSGCEHQCLSSSAHYRYLCLFWRSPSPVCRPLVMAASATLAPVVGLVKQNTAERGREEEERDREDRMAMCVGKGWDSLLEDVGVCKEAF